MQFKGRARLDKRTKDLVKRLRKNDIAFIDHDDIDEVAAMGLIEARPLVIVNSDQSITGKYPTRGVLNILKAGITVLDEVGQQPFEQLKENQMVEVRGGSIYQQGRLVATGNVLTIADVEARLSEAQDNLRMNWSVSSKIRWNMRAEKGILLDYIELPQLRTRIKGRHVLIVVRGKNYKEDLKAITTYIEEQKPFLIGVDGGADALVEYGLRPDIVVGDMDSVSDETLQSGAEIVVHAYPDGRAPGLERVQKMGLPAKVVPMPGTSEDVAMILAHQNGAELLVAVGTHSNMIDFLEKGRKGMASTFLVRLRVGSILVDAKGVSQLYHQHLRAKYLVQLLVAACIPIIILLCVSPSTKSFLRLISLQFKLLFNL